MFEHFARRPRFHDLAEIHHQHTVAQKPDHGKVVRDEQVAHAGVLLQPLQQLENDDLHGNVQRRGRLVEHQEIGLDRHGAGDADAGALAARELMRKARQQLQRQAALARHRLDPRFERGAAQFAQSPQRIGNGGESGETRIDAFAGVLEHHLDAGAVAIAREYARRLERQFAGAELDAAVADVDQPGQRPHQSRLAAAGLADQSDRLALGDGETDVIDGMDFGDVLRPAGQAALKARPRAETAGGRKQLGDFGNVEQRGHAALTAGG